MEIILLCISNVKIKEGVKLTGYQWFINCYLCCSFTYLTNKKLNKFRLITVTIQEIGYRRYSGKQLWSLTCNPQKDWVWAWVIYHGIVEDAMKIRKTLCLNWPHWRGFITKKERVSQNIDHEIPESGFNAISESRRREIKVCVLSPALVTNSVHMNQYYKNNSLLTGSYALLAKYCYFWLTCPST